MIVKGVSYKPENLHVKTWKDGESKLTVKGKRAYATTIVAHETVTRSVSDTVKVLKTREKGNLGIHLIGAPDGSFTQHADLCNEIVWHAGAHNSVSIGVEIVNPYYPEYLKKNDPWDTVIDAPWAHKKKYVVPTKEQAESFTQLVLWCVNGDVPGISVPRIWPSVDGNKFYMGPAPKCKKPTQGIYSHHNIGNHADGSWLVLYAWMRIEAGLSAYLAYDEAIRRSKDVKSYIDIGDLINQSKMVYVPPLPWTEEDELQLEDLCPGTWSSLTSEPVCK